MLAYTWYPFDSQCNVYLWLREAFNKKKIKSVDFFQTSQTRPWKMITVTIFGSYNIEISWKVFNQKNFKGKYPPLWCYNFVRVVKLFSFKIVIFEFWPLLQKSCSKFFLGHPLALKIQVINSHYQIWIVPKSGVSYIYMCVLQ